MRSAMKRVVGTLVACSIEEDNRKLSTLPYYMLVNNQYIETFVKWPRHISLSIQLPVDKP